MCISPSEDNMKGRRERGGYEGDLHDRNKTSFIIAASSTPYPLA
jgi:hypothetical protein